MNWAKLLNVFVALILVSCSSGSDDSDSSDTPNQKPSQDTTPPVISLIGPKQTYHVVGTDYVDPGATYSDDSGETPSSSVEGEVDVNTIGTYYIYYRASDSSGNSKTEVRTISVMSESLVDYYNFLRDEKGVLRTDFTDQYLMGMESSIYAQEALQAGDYESASQIVENAFDEYPLYENSWRDNAKAFGLNNGDPIGYYSLRMIDKVTQVLPIESIGTFTITAVMVLCTNATRPINTNYDTEEVYLELDNRMLENNNLILHEAIYLFELWMKAITNGLDTKTNVHIQEECTKTNFSVSDNGYGNSRILSSYANNREIVNRVPKEIREQTNLWLVITPSGVVGDGSAFPDYWVDGGMGLSDKKVPLMIATDKHFLRKYYMNGSGDYTSIERRVYQPQWFQHEIMHHLYRTWPEYQLEVTGHDWFVRSFWPNDFEGTHEPDYYWETIEKRLLQASPTLAEGLSIVEWSSLDINDIGFEALEGKWEDTNASNNYHYVEIIKDNGFWWWTNLAGVKWLMYEEDGVLKVDTAWAYGIQIASLKPNSNGGLSAIFFNGGEFRKVEDFSVGTNTSKAKDDYQNNSQGIEYFCNGYHPY